MKIYKAEITTEDLIHQFLPANYKEAFETVFSSDKDISPDDIMIDFWTENPSWIDFLFKLRNILVRPFGLQQPEIDTNRKRDLERCIKGGESFNVMSISAKNDKETVMCLTDSHLTAYIAIQQTLQANNKKIKVSTLVKYHNLLGKIYFFVITPFHFLIVKSKIKQIVKKLE